MKIIMLKGLPGSGKSTWANQYVTDNPNAIRVNKDDLRRMLKGPKWSKTLEPGVLVTRDNIVSWALANERDVIVDDTNFAPKHEKRLRELARNMEAEFEIKFFDTPLTECIKNDLNRPKSVGEKVIRRMWNEFIAPKQEKPVYDRTLPEAVICDLDGTLALHVARSPYDADKLETDAFDEEILTIIQDAHEACKEIIFCSGREEKYREATIRWLNTRLSSNYTQLIYMRPTGDKREDSIVKQEIYDREIKGKYNVMFVLDDRNRVVDMWRRNGLKCLQVAEGDF